MKKILSKGSISKYRAKCSFCDCEFEYQWEDVRYYRIFDYGIYVDCPNCSKLIRHTESVSTTIKISTESFEDKD